MRDDKYEISESFSKLQIKTWLYNKKLQAALAGMKGQTPSWSTNGPAIYLRIHMLLSQNFS